MQEVEEKKETAPEVQMEPASVPAIDKPKPVIFCGLPSYNGENPIAQTFEIFNQNQFPMRVRPFKFSLLAFSFNSLWADALNSRKTHGVTHFLLIHSDIVPISGQKWLETLVNEMEAVGADVLSVVAPLKNTDGITSTGIQIGKPYHPWMIKRYTMKEIFDLPETFTHEKLVVNTGMMLVDMRKPWVEKIHFHIKDDIIMRKDGLYEAIAFPEDWNFSEEAKALGAKVFSTRKVKIEHHGTQIYPNDAVWGTMQTDQVFLTAEPFDK